MARLTLVRHGRPVIDPDLPAAAWTLDPDGLPSLRRLRLSLPDDAAWFSSPEPKATATAAVLTDRPVVRVDDLREAERPAMWFDDPAAFTAAVRRSIERPDVPALGGWEPVSATRSRVVAAVRGLLADQDPSDELVLVGHGTAWTLLVAELTGRPPDLDGWEHMAMPDLAMLDVSASGAKPLVRDWAGG